MGGKLDIESVPGRGTRVTMVAPLLMSARDDRKMSECGGR